MANFLDRYLQRNIQSALGGLVTTQNAAINSALNVIPLGDAVTFYTEDDGHTYIDKGYNANSDVYSIVSRCAAKFAQVPWYVYKVKDEKAAKAYRMATKDISNGEAYRDMLKLRKKALDEQIVENDLSQLLSKPNRNQGQDSFFEQLYGFKLLTGEGNIWLNAEDADSQPEELFIIPKPNLLLRGTRNDPWDILGYILDLNGTQTPVDKANIIMWKAANYDFDPATLSHLRGNSPLKALLLSLQASNAAAEREVRLYENAGVNGVLFDASDRPTPLTPQQVSDIRNMVGNRIAGMDKVGTVTTMQGKWGYLQMGMDAQQLRLLENKKLTTQTLCNGFGMPYELMNPETTYANKLEAKRGWVYDMIAPAAYSCRDELNRVLLKRFGLSRDQYFIDCDIMALPDVAEDLKKQVEAVKDAWWLDLNEKREYMGYDKKNDPLFDKVYAPSSLKPLDQLAAGDDLDDEENLLTNKNMI